MNKKRGILFIGLLILLSFISVAVAEDMVKEDVIVGVIVVAIILVLIVIVLFMVLKKKAKTPAKLDTKKESHEEIHGPIHEKAVKFHQEHPAKLREHETHKPEKPKFEEAIALTQKATPAGSAQQEAGGFLARARRLQSEAPSPEPSQEQKKPAQADTSEEELGAHDYKMKTCPRCSFDVLEDEKECPVCGKKL